MGKYAPTARVQITRLQKQLDDFVGRCAAQPAGTELQADMYQYAYVRLCGFLEQAVLLVGQSRVEQQAFAEGRAFGRSFLERTNRNPTADTITGFVRRFSPLWAAELEAWLATDDRASQINSLVGIRNGNAHGSSYGGSSTWFVNYNLIVYELIDWLLERFEPLPRPAS